MQLTAYLWAYHVRPEQVEAFRRAYGPEGEWADFFRRSDAYIRTDLLSDRTEPNRFVTIDYFADPQARAHLLEAYGDVYLALDRRWTAATLTEAVIGEFSLNAEIGGPGPARTVEVYRRGGWPHGGATDGQRGHRGGVPR